ncbi:hypothetical protein GUITHDRAFT_119905 [Guillardia theta CCMP2712]|uniref:Uncharacterized protein n=1 Tax=Guillardia theta (strain CCMP2712) TaxID=905079 RepID=L1ICW5_GUITC|nr:hypothetical protein GUITHDRAFT_119905 [Guillardia theta CCMP2712]EKX33922.1 hypothetical protein GUITHDRAFT_119905 [Guillardia theta CCMP2712]|eukprot:XP_005820902.1 hypothetical protein GUITHDRAFT_119905 [Guillardia theta CCMP2712]
MQDPYIKYLMEELQKCNDERKFAKLNLELKAALERLALREERLRLEGMMFTCQNPEGKEELKAALERLAVREELIRHEENFREELRRAEQNMKEERLRLEGMMFTCQNPEGKEELKAALERLALREERLRLEGMMFTCQNPEGKEELKAALEKLAVREERLRLEGMMFTCQNPEGKEMLILRWKQFERQIYRTPIQLSSFLAIRKIPEYSNNSEFIRFPAQYLKLAGVGEHLAEKENDSMDAMVYCRQAVQEQMKFMQEAVMKRGCFGWVNGSPGTGKSLTALAFCLGLNSSAWNVCWLHLSMFNLPEGLLRNEQGVRAVKLLRYSDEDMLSGLGLNEFNRPGLIILDGYRKTERYELLIELLSDWRNQDKSMRRLLVVTSMSGNIKIQGGEDTRLGMEFFFVNPWTEQEYLSAIKCNEFYELVKENLDTEMFLESHGKKSDRSIRRIRIRSKYFYAGKSSRCMFAWNTSEVIKRLRRALTAVQDFESHMSSGTQSPNLIDGLFSVRRDAVSQSDCLTFVSEFVAFEFAIRMGPDRLRKCAALFEPNDPIMQGKFFEILFFATIAAQDLKIFWRVGGNGTKIWPKGVVKIVSNNFDQTFFDGNENGLWAKPLNFNHPAYDGVFLNKTDGSVRFVQVTIAKEHSFNLAPCAKFLEKMTNIGFCVRNVEFYFVVPKALERFKVSNFSNPSALTNYGWENGAEWNKIQVIGIDIN